MKTKKCIIPGSFDPVTRGHTELFKTAAELFDEVFPVILVNGKKNNGMFSPEERLAIMNCAVDFLRSEGYANITPKLYSGLTSEAAYELGAKYIVKGARNGNDFDYEYQLFEIMRRFDPSLSTVILPSRAELACVSSTYVRELITYGKLESPDLAPGTMDIIKGIMNK